MIRSLCKVLLFSGFLLACTSVQKKYSNNHLIISESSIKHVPVYIDARFSGNDRLNVGYALETWNYAFNGQVVLDIHYNTEQWTIKQFDDIHMNQGIAIIYLSENEGDNIPTLSNDPFQAQKVLAWVNELGGNKVYVLRNRIKEKNLFYITLHELGHIFGVQHSDENNLMQPNYYINTQACVDKSTATAAALYLGINPKYMNWCEV